MARVRPKLAVFKFASCDGCQLTLLDAEDHLLEVAGQVDICYFLEATSRVVDGPYDLALVEGSITTAHDAARIREVRRNARFLITLGACATAGGIQSLRNWGNLPEFLQAVYARPEYIQTLATSTAIAAHVSVDFELRGCPINKAQLLDVLRAFLADRRPNVPKHSVCLDCKRHGTVCIMVAQGVPCMGPITQTGCGALCPSYDRGCYGCYGPCEQSQGEAWGRSLVRSGQPVPTVLHQLRSFNAGAEDWRQAGDSLDNCASTAGPARTEEPRS